MSDPSDWLPPLAVVDGPREDTLKALYRQFLDDFRDDRCSFGGSPIRWDGRFVPGQSYDYGFWHLVSTEDSRTHVRRFDPRRAERLPWCAAIIRNAAQPEVLVYDYKHGSKRERTYFWLEEHDFLVALEYRDRGDSYAMFIVSAFYIDGPASRRTIRKQYERRIREY